MMNVFYIEFYMTKRILKEQGKEEFTEEDIPLFYHNFFTFFNKIIREYSEVVACWEGRNSLEWRRNIFPDYKRDRDTKKGEPEYKTLMSCIPDIQECLNYYPIKQISVDGAEADDVMFVIANHYRDEKHVIMTSDKDLVQIKNVNPNVDVYNPVKKKFLQAEKNIVEEKAIVGDKSDNIGGLYRVGIKTFEKMIEDRVVFNKVMSKGNNKEIFKQFLKIVDLRNIPESLKENIISEFEKTKYNIFQKDQIEAFFFKNKLKDLLMRW